MPVPRKFWSISTGQWRLVGDRAQYTSLCIASSGFECTLAFQRNLSLHGAAISEPIFELLESQQSIEKASKVTCSKGCHPLQRYLSS